MYHAGLSLWPEKCVLALRGGADSSGVLAQPKTSVLGASTSTTGSGTTLNEPGRFLWNTSAISVATNFVLAFKAVISDYGFNGPLFTLKNSAGQTILNLFMRYSSGGDVTVTWNTNSTGTTWESRVGFVPPIGLPVNYVFHKTGQIGLHYINGASVKNGGTSVYVLYARGTDGGALTYGNTNNTVRAAALWVGNIPLNHGTAVWLSHDVERAWGGSHVARLRRHIGQIAAAEYVPPQIHIPRAAIHRASRW